MSVVTLHWSGTIHAQSSLGHGGEQRGTITTLRRETVIQPDGRAVLVPIVSGNAWRGRLRRIGEELLREVLDYEGQLSLTAAHALRGGGSLARTTGDPLSGRRLAELRARIPQVGVFGCAAGGRIIDGCLRVGKVVPRIAQTSHLLAGPPAELGWLQATQLETYLRQDDTTSHSFADVLADPAVAALPHDDTGAPLLPADPVGDRMLMYRVETFPAGTSFETWCRLERATAEQAAFFTEVLDRFSADGRLGSRAGIGHGQVRLELTRAVVAGDAATADAGADWRGWLTENRTAAMDLLALLT